MKALTYTKTPPTVAGMYWHLADAESDPTIVKVFKDADGYWSVRYDSLHLAADASWSDEQFNEPGFGDGVDFLENWSRRTTLWAGPIPVPKLPKSPDSIDLA